MHLYISEQNGLTQSFFSPQLKVQYITASNFHALKLCSGAPIQLVGKFVPKLAFYFRFQYYQHYHLLCLSSLSQVSKSIAIVYISIKKIMKTSFYSSVASSNFGRGSRGGRGMYAPLYAPYITARPSQIIFCMDAPR